MKNRPARFLHATLATLAAADSDGIPSSEVLQQVAVAGSSTTKLACPRPRRSGIVGSGVLDPAVGAYERSRRLP
jgi:hypothetical protein